MHLVTWCIRALQADPILGTSLASLQLQSVLRMWSLLATFETAISREMEDKISCGCSALALAVLIELEAATQTRPSLDTLLYLADRTKSRASILANCMFFSQGVLAQATFTMMTTRFIDVLTTYDEDFNASERLNDPLEFNGHQEESTSSKCFLGDYELDDSDCSILEAELIRSRLEELCGIIAANKDAMAATLHPSKPTADKNRNWTLGVLSTSLTETLDKIRRRIAAQQLTNY